mgnify:CR=1 FL=1
MESLYLNTGLIFSCVYLVAYFINVTFWKFTDHKLLNGIIGETESDEDLFFGSMLSVIVAIMIGLINPILIFSGIISLIVHFLRRFKRKEKEVEPRSFTIV